MSEWVDVAAVSDLPPGERKLIDIDDVLIIVLNHEGEFYAIEDLCTHDGGELSKGSIIKEENAIMCPRHGALFCLKTGNILEGPGYGPTNTFPVRIEGDTVQVKDDRWD